MPTFYFHMWDGEHLILDEEGANFEDVETAASEARESAREWAIQIIRNGKKIDGQTIEMVDERGVVRLTLPLQLCR